MSSSSLSIVLKEKQLFLDFQGEDRSYSTISSINITRGFVFMLPDAKINTEAEDLVQDFFVHILENRENITIESCVKSYFIRSVHNRCLDYLAHQKVITSHELYRQKIMAEEDFQEYPLLDNELKQQIDRTIRNLPDGMRETFIRNRFDGLTYQQIATQENISVKTVEYRISKVLSILRKDLVDYLPFLLFVSRF